MENETTAQRRSGYDYRPSWLVGIVCGGDR